MKFWFEKGVDGFRMDAITYIAKDESFPAFTEEEIQKQMVNGQVIMLPIRRYTIT